jgi:hypothetical protein
MAVTALLTVLCCHSALAGPQQQLADSASREVSERREQMRQKVLARHRERESAVKRQACKDEAFARLAGDYCLTELHGLMPANWHGQRERIGLLSF